MASGVIEKIKSHINNGENFLLSGGAGSGKTFTLMEVLEFVHSTDPSANIACITYTNAAVDVIKDRRPYKNIKTSTIHDFLWDIIKNYQNDLKISLLALLRKEKEKENTGIKYFGDQNLNSELYQHQEIKYKEYKKLEEGIISHNEVLKITSYMFETYPLLCEILIDKYDYILIDEYQDAEEQVIKIFLNYINKIEHKTNIIGTFGDSMQSIYNNGIGNLNSYIEDGTIKEVIIEDNWRCSTEVIKLLNNIRTDITQKPKPEGKADSGSINFVFSYAEDVDIESLKNNEDLFNDWDFTDYNETKELYLTHKLIALDAGFGEIFDVYSKDEIIKQVSKIKTYMKNHLEEKTKIENKTFGEVLNLNLVNAANNFKNFIKLNPELFDYAKNIPFENLSKIYLNSDKLFGDDKDALINHLFKIQEVIHLYEKNDVNSFIRKTEYKIKSVQDKIDLKKSIEDLKEMRDKTILDIIAFAHDSRLVIKDDNFNSFQAENEYTFHKVKDLIYEQLINLYNFEQDLTPYSTQHGIKGEEFNNVFVILDNGGWNNYNFKYLFEDTPEKESIIERTKKMFYVCCSRAKENLVVFYYNPTPEVLSKAEFLFGGENMVEV
ncbi:ATP-dependent helicase [Candidatus Marinimicrobia bacterium MT.SAG.2]|nr:ATP-dependent helicase [Candidatus Marinimicrobia bacterium MT.SAG.2]